MVGAAGVGPALVNLSIRAAAGTGSDTLVTGFVVRGGVLPLLVRGVGPGLTAFGVVGPVADPRLMVFDPLGVGVASNDDWDAGPVRQTAIDVGAFALSGGSKDAATLVSLATGADTMHLGSGAAVGGQALAEIYSAEPESIEINGALRGQPGNIQDNVFQSLCIDPRDSNTVFIGTETNGIFKTTDGGASWKRSRKGFRVDINKTGYPQIYEIAVDSTRPGTLYAATVAAPGPATGSGLPVLRSGNAGVYQSTDGGLTWQQRINGFYGQDAGGAQSRWPRDREFRRVRAGQRDPLCQ